MSWPPIPPRGRLPELPSCRAQACTETSYKSSSARPAHRPVGLRIRKLNLPPKHVGESLTLSQCQFFSLF